MDHNEEFNTHHRKPLGLGGTNELRNLSRVPGKKHNAWHGFTNKDNGNGISNPMNPLEIAQYINSHFLDPDYKFICVKTEDFQPIVNTLRPLRFEDPNQGKLFS